MKDSAVHPDAMRHAPDEVALVPTRCPECGYSLEGLPREGICPECGERHDQQYIVLFGASGRGERIALDVALGALVVMVGFITFRELRSQSAALRDLAWIIVMALIPASGLFYRFRMDREILVQVWLGEPGFMQRNFGPRRSWSSRLQHVPWVVIYLMLAPISAVPAFWREGVVVVLIIPVLLLLLAMGVAALWMIERRRSARTDDPRVPRLYRWTSSDEILVRREHPARARITITCSTCLGDLIAYKFSPVKATVALDETKLPLLRQKLEAWRDQAARREASAE